MTSNDSLFILPCNTGINLYGNNPISILLRRLSILNQISEAINVVERRLPSLVPMQVFYEHKYYMNNKDG